MDDLTKIQDAADPALDHLRACNQPAPRNPPEKPDSSLREAVERKLWAVNCPDATYDEALQGATRGDQADIDALEFIRGLADTAIAVVVERLCDPSSVIEAQSRVLHNMGVPHPRISKQWLREYHEQMIRALARKE